MDFRSDNVVGVHPAIMAALARENARRADSSYGADAATARLTARLRDVFEHPALVVHPVVTGTAANALTLACLAPPWGAVFCHREAHIYVDEANAPEFYGAGLKLVPLQGASAKLDLAALEEAVHIGDHGVHNPMPAAVSVSQASECGASWTPDELAPLAAFCRGRGLALHMDGTRFANSLAFLGCTPAELSWKAGVDALSLGATKNGAMAAEAAVFFDPAKAAEFERRRKRGGHLLSKMRFVSAQLDAWLEGGLWLANARHANAMARRIGEGLAALPGARLLHPVEANEVFVAIPAAANVALDAAGYKYYPWPSGRAGETAYRLVAAFDTDPADVDRLLAIARAAV